MSTSSGTAVCIRKRQLVVGDGGVQLAHRAFTIQHAAVQPLEQREFFGLYIGRRFVRFDVGDGILPAAEQRALIQPGRTAPKPTMPPAL